MTTQNPSDAILAAAGISRQYFDANRAALWVAHKIARATVALEGRTVRVVSTNGEEITFSATGEEITRQGRIA